MAFEHIKKDDTVVRMLAGRIPIEMKVTDVDDKLIHCGPWTFSRDTGYEIDEDIPCLVSYLKK